MSDGRFHFWRRWFTWANVTTLGVGLLVAFAGNSLPLALHNDLTREVFFGGEAFSPEVLRLKNWLFGVIGASIVGFHALMIMLSEYALRRREQWAYRAAWLGLLSWFGIDTGVSLYHGAVHNVLLINLVALVLIGLPLAMMRPAWTDAPVAPRGE